MKKGITLVIPDPRPLQIIGTMAVTRSPNIHGIPTATTNIVLFGNLFADPIYQMAEPKYLPISLME